MPWQNRQPKRPEGRVLLSTVCRGRRVDVLVSPGGRIGEMHADPDEIVIDGYEVTDADLDRGWVEAPKP